jgi:hypothetical protein
MLGGRRAPLEVREAGVGGSCPRCLTLYSTDAHYCWRCGLALTEEAEAGGVLEFDDLDAEEPVPEEPVAEEPIADEPADTVEADALDPEEPNEPEPSPNGATDEQLTSEIEAGRLSSRSRDATRS